MRILSTTLLSAQKSPSRTPAISLQARNLLHGVVDLLWERLYTGSEADCPHALTLPGDGSLIRLRITPAVDNRKLYRQRVINPGSDSDFNQWTYLNQYNIVNCAACSLGAEVSLFWIKSNGEINLLKSLDNGTTWQSIEYPGYSPTNDVSGLAAAYKPNGDLALFFTVNSVLYIIKRISGVWQSREAWDKTAGDLTGVTAYYDGDWKLLVCGRDTAGNFKVWSLVYGDGDEVSAGTWSNLKEIASAPADGAYEYNNLFLDKPDEYRCFYVEKFTGTESYSRPFWSHTLPDTSFLENRWREPVPFATESPSGLALAHHGTEAWLSMPSGVWRAGLAEESLDLSKDVLAVKAVNIPLSPGGIQGDFPFIVELRNDRGRYSQLLAQNSPLAIGCRIDFSPGYRTSQGNEYSSGLSFTLQAYEHTCSGGKAGLLLYAADGWTALENWIARYQFRWNKPDRYGDPVQEANIKEIITQILARSGLKLDVISQSTVAAGFCPDFTIHPGDNGKTVINRLLSFIPDVLFLEGDTAYLVDPLAADSATYSYFSPLEKGNSLISPLEKGGLRGIFHTILEGRYRTSNWKINRVRVEGNGVLAESFAWDEVQKQGDILEMVEDLNLDTAARAHERGEAYLRQAEIDSISGFIRVPVNCGQQLYDVVEITDPGAGLAASKRRILGITLTYLPSKGQYDQKLILGKV